MLNFLQFCINESIVDFTVLRRLDLLEECGLLMEFVLASSLRSGIGWHVVLVSVILVLQFLGQNGKLRLWIAVSDTVCQSGLLCINTMSVTTNESYSAFTIAASALI